MAFCTKCGAHIPDDATYCSHCGTTWAKNNAGQSAHAQPGPQSHFTSNKDYTATMNAADIQQNKVMAILSYLSLLVLIPIFAAKNSPFAQFHAKQGLIVLIAQVAVNLLLFVPNCIFIINLIFLPITWLLNLAFLALMIIGIVYAAQGQAKELPIIGRFSKYLTF